MQLKLQTIFKSFAAFLDRLANVECTNLHCAHLAAARKILLARGPWQTWQCLVSIVQTEILGAVVELMPQVYLL